MLCLRCLFLHRPVTLVSTYVFWTAPCPECDVFKSFCTLKSTRNCQTSTFLQNVWSVGFEIDRPCPQWCNWSGVSAAQVAKRSWISSCIFSRGQLLILLCECTYVYLHNVPPTDVSISCSLTLFWQRMKNVCISALFFFSTTGIVDISQMIKQFYEASGHRRCVNIILELNMRRETKISNRACKVTCL